MKKKLILIFLILNTLSYSEKYSFTLDIEDTVKDINIVIVKEVEEKLRLEKVEAIKRETLLPTKVLNSALKPFEELLITGITKKHILFSNGLELSLDYSKISDLSLEKIIVGSDKRRFMKVRLNYKGRVKDYEVGDRVYYFK